MKEHLVGFLKQCQSHSHFSWKCGIWGYRREPSFSKKVWHRGVICEFYWSKWKSPLFPRNCGMKELLVFFEAMITSVSLFVEVRNLGSFQKMCKAYDSDGPLKPKRDNAKMVSNYYYSATSVLYLIFKKLRQNIVLCAMKHFEWFGINQANKSACVAWKKNFIIPCLSFKKKIKSFSFHVFIVLSWNLEFFYLL